MKTKNAITISLLAPILILAIYVSPLILSGSIMPFIVLSESMVPTMLVGDAIIMQKVHTEDIKIGDIIAFYPKDGAKTSVSHRVIEIYNDNGKLSFQTKGDNVEHKDPFIVDSKNVIGKAVFKIPYIGYLTKSSGNPMLFLIFTIVPSIIIVADEVRKMTKSSTKIKRVERDQKKMKKKEERAINEINYVRFIVIFSIGNMITFILNVPYVNPEFWENFSNSPYIMSGIFYILIQTIILFVSLPLWLQNRYSGNYEKELKKEIKRGLYNIRKTIS